MASKLVSDQGKLGHRVAAATADRARNDRAMQGFIARCSDVVPEGTTSVTLEEAQHYLGRQMEHEIEDVRHSDDDNVRQQVDLDAKRKERDQAVVEVYGTVLKTRQGFELTHGEGSGKQLLGLDTEVPDDPVRLYQMADRCRSWLRDPTLELPEPKLAGFRFDREETAAGLDAPVDRLGRALEVLPREEKHSVDTSRHHLPGTRSWTSKSPAGRAGRRLPRPRCVPGTLGMRFGPQISRMVGVGNPIQGRKRRKSREVLRPVPALPPLPGRVWRVGGRGGLLAVHELSFRKAQFLASQGDFESTLRLIRATRDVHREIGERLKEAGVFDLGDEEP